MRQSLRATLAILFHIIVTVLFSFSNSVIAQEKSATVLINGSDLTSIYDQQSGYSNRSEYTNNFAAWVITPVGQTLYIGLGGQPGFIDGAQLLHWENGTLTNLPVINNGSDKKITEEGLSDMVWLKNSSTLVLAGTDPTDKRDPAHGNMYILKSDNGIRKYREDNGLEGVVHTWGIEEINGFLYAAVDSSSPKFPQRIGEIFQSTDEGTTWKRITKDPTESKNPNDYLAEGAWDVTGFNNAMYVMKNNGGISELIYTSDNAKTWNTVNSSFAYAGPKMTKFKNTLIYVGSSARTLSAINTENQETVHTIPSVFPASYHSMATDGTYLYIITHDSKVYFSSDLENWDIASTFENKNLASIVYWPERQGFVVSTNGPVPTIYFMPQQEPTQEIQKSCTVSISKPSFSDTETVKVTVSGLSSKNTPEPIRMFLKLTNNSKISPIPTGTTHIENLAVKTNYYQFGESVCQSESGNPCSKSFEIKSLPAGSYQFHCDLPEEPNSCSGNPNCSFNGGTLACEGWETCGQNDSVAFTITKSSPIEPKINDPDYNNNGVVDIYDYNIFSQNYGKDDCSLNLAEKCVINELDFQKMMLAFNENKD